MQPPRAGGPARAARVVQETTHAATARRRLHDWPRRRLMQPASIATAALKVGPRPAQWPAPITAAVRVAARAGGPARAARVVQETTHAAGARGRPGAGCMSGAGDNS